MEEKNEISSQIKNVNYRKILLGIINILVVCSVLLGSIIYSNA